MRLCSLCKKLTSDDRATCPDHASVPSPTHSVAVEPLPAALAERFPQHEAFALGSTGTLYRLGDSSVLLKVLHASLTRDAAERARYRRELRRQQNLVHPQLPRVHDVGESAGRIWFTRDFIEGDSLEARLRGGEALDLATAYSIVMQLSAALDGLHQLGLVHRDVKPGHVLLRANRSPRESLQLIDATVAGPLVAGDALRHGTPDYAAKELVEGAPATFRSDLYALGCLSYELLAGAPPFRDRTAGAAADALATLAAHRESEPAELPARVPEAVRSLITSMLAKDAHRRPFSAQQVRRALEPQLAPANAAARRASLSDTQPRAAALRFRVPAAKPVTPATFPDATVELDVEDLDDAIQVNDEPAKPADAKAPDVAASTAEGENTGPTKALSTQNTRAIMSSMLPSASKPASESAPRPPTHAPTGTKFGLGPVRAQDIEAATARAAERKSAPLLAARQEDTSAARSSASLPTATSSGAPVPTSASAPTIGEIPGNASSNSPSGASSVSPGATYSSSPTAASTTGIAGAASSSSPSGASSGSPVAASDSSLTAAPSGAFGGGASSSSPSGASSTDGLGAGASSSASSVGASSSSLPAAAGSSVAGLPPSAAKPPSPRRKRYTSATQPLLQDPRLLLFAAAGLVALIFLLRVVLGPAAPSRSSAVVVQVPDTNDELAQIERQAERDLDQLSEAALIGGNIPRTPQPTAAQRRQAARAQQNDQLIQSDGLQPSAAAERGSASSASTEPAGQRVAAVAAAPVVEPVDEGEAKNVPTVNAGSVRGGLARAANNRQAAMSGTNVSAVNANDSPDTDHKAKGRALFKAGKYTEAVEAYQRATKRDSSDAAAFAGLGGSLLAKGETRRAITAYQHAVRLQPEVSGFQAALGRAYLEKGDRSRARAAYSKALSLDPNNQAARNGLANTNPR